MNDRPLKVLLVVGRGRSGSTILDNILGQLPGFVSTGELNNLWRRGLVRGRHCGCGERLVHCGFWRRVLEGAHDDPRLGRLEASDVVAWQARVVRQRHLPRILAGTPGRPTGWEPLDDYVRLLGRTYRALAEVAGASVVVDSSKRPEHAAIVRLVRGIDVFYLHLVRDPRGVAFSRQRRKVGPDGEMSRYGTLEGTVAWIQRNVEVHLLARRVPSGRFKRVRYDRFASEPRPTVREVLDFLGERREELPFVDDRTVRLRATHTAAGNPSRFFDDEVEIVPDDEWKTEQRSRDRWLVTATTLPLLALYGIPIRVRPASPSTPDPIRERHGLADR